MNEVYEKLLKCYACFEDKIDFKPQAALILGSGLGDYADTNMKVEAVLDYHDIEGFPVSTVLGHKGRFVFGYVRDVPVVCMQHIVPQLALERIHQLVKAEDLVAQRLNEQRQRPEDDRHLRAQRRNACQISHFSLPFCGALHRLEIIPRQLMRQILQRDLASRLLARDGCRVLGVVDFDVCYHSFTPLSDKFEFFVHEGVGREDDAGADAVALCYGCTIVGIPSY